MAACLTAQEDHDARRYCERGTIEEFEEDAQRSAPHLVLFVDASIGAVQPGLDVAIHLVDPG